MSSLISITRDAPAFTAATAARPHPDRYVGDVQRRHSGEELSGVGRDTEHQVGVKRGDHLEVSLVGEFGCVFTRLLEVATGLDEGRAERTHRRVLARTVAVGNDDLDIDTECPSGERNALTMIAACCADQPPRLSGAVDRLGDVTIDVHQSAAHLEGSRRRVVLVLDPDVCAELVCQHRPRELRRRRHELGHQRRRPVEFVERKRE